MQQKTIKKLNKQLVSLFSKTIDSFVSNKTNIFLQDCSNLNRDQIKDLIDEIKSIHSNSISVFIYLMKIKLIALLEFQKNVLMNIMLKNYLKY